MTIFARTTIVKPVSYSIRELKEQLRSLAQKDRASLALDLIESLDPGMDEDAEDLWLHEAQKRLADYDAGKTESRPVDDVISEIKSRIG